MKLGANGNKESIGNSVRVTVSDQVKKINNLVVSRGLRAVNAMRNAELRVLKGERSGRVYKKPGTYGKALKATKKLLGDYGHKLRGGQLYRASAPGEAPAMRTNSLRLHWNGQVKKENRVDGVMIVAELESAEPYAAALEHGTPRMKARPFVEKIKQEAAPEIKRIYGEPYA